MALKNRIAESLLGLKQAVRSLNRRRLRRRRAAQRAGYAQWVAQHDTPDAQTRRALEARAAAIAKPPLLSVIVPTYNPRAEWMQALFDCLRAQIYPHWQLCIADDASPDPQTQPLLQRLAAGDARVRLMRRESNGHISAASNSALELAEGEFVVMLDHDDVLAPHALLMVAEAVRRFPQARLFYSDEDKLGPDGERESPNFKPDWNHDLCLAQNFVCHLAAYERSLVAEVGGFRVGLEGSQDHDLVLRCVERLRPEQIVHIPHVLYHWRMHPDSTAGASESKPYTSEAGRRAVQEHLERCAVDAEVSIATTGRYRVRYRVRGTPRVAVIIPTRNQAGLLAQCVETLVKLTDYPDYEVIVVDNGSDDERALRLLDTLSRRDRFRVLRDPTTPFNFSALNNRAVAQAEGAEFVVLMNNDIEVIEPGWLAEMVGHAARPHVGAVGARLLYPDRTLQHGGIVLGLGKAPPRVASLAFKGLPERAGGHGGRAKTTQSYSAVTAACLAVRRARYLEVGGLDEDHLAVAYNDVDFCLRLREAGYTNVWTPYATLIHHESVSRGRDASATHAERFAREAAYMRERWGAVLDHDPAYNPNLNGVTADFALAEPPRVSLRTPWFETPLR